MLEHYRKQRTEDGRPKAVELFGETSDIIWPQLEREVLSRFPDLGAMQ